MSKSYKIKDGFWLNEMVVKMPETKVPQKVAKHQYIILDRSGSMWHDLDNVLDTVIKYVDSLTEGSTVSLGWFSGNSEYGLSVPYELKKERDGVVKTVDSYRSTLGCTNFTEILEKIEKDCTDRNASLYFFTDGWHNCGAFQNVRNILEQLKDKIDVSVFVGCGYINRDNMTEMASIMGGSFCHIESFTEFEQTLYDFGVGVTESVPGCKVTPPINVDCIFSLLGKNVISYEQDENFEVFYKASNKKKQVLYFTSDYPHYEEAQPTKSEQHFRALAYYLVQHNDTPKALEVLDFLGDKYFINQLYNCFTNDEYAKVESQLLKSIFDTKKRYQEGQVIGFLPADDAFCVLDALDMLTNDDDACIHLNDKDFVYNKISREKEQLDGSKLIYPKDLKANVATLKYNETKLNVNLQVDYTAEVPLNSAEFTKTNAINESLAPYKIKEGSNYPVKCIRNYAIIADAKLNTPQLVLSGLSKQTIKELGAYLTKRGDSKYILNLANLPLINKSYLKETSAKQLAEKAWQAKQLGVELSVLRYLMKLSIIKGTGFTEDASLKKVLESCYYIKNGMYQPPKKEVEATDEYMAYEFEISFKGYSTATASSVIKKIDEGKKLTDREIPVQLAYDKYKEYSSDEVVLTYKAKSTEYKKLNEAIQHAKFAILLINRGSMPEFSSRDDMSIMLNEKIGTEDKEILAQFKVTQKPVKI